MSVDVLMPALSPTMEEGTLSKWLVKPGDKVRSGDVIAEIETDKATMDVEAVDDGVVETILVPEGTEQVKVNTPIARLSGDAPAAPSSPPATAAPSKAPAKPAAEPSKAPTAAADQRVLASPLARRLAEETGVDLSAVHGSGPHGRVIRSDVEGRKAAPPPALKPPPAAKPAAAEAPKAAPTLEQMGIPPGSYDLVPLDIMRRTIARRMSDSFRDVPHFPLTIDIELDELLAARTKVNRALDSEGVKVSVNDMLIKAAGIALKRVPDANASYTPGGIARHHHADVAVAVAIEGGLITPIVRSAETKGLAEIAREMKDLAERARTRKLLPQEYQGGTFSISNLGMFGIKSFASIVNEPQGAILSVGAGEKRAVVRGDALAIATVMSVTLTCDHRVVDGAIGARWLSAFKSLVENPIAMVL